MVDKRFSREYADYIRSDEWREKAQRRKAMDGNKCVICGSTYNLQVHHTTYERLGHEDIEHDLVTLCSECHAGVHDNKSAIKNGIIKGQLILRIDRTADRLEGFLRSRGIAEMASEASNMWRSEMRVLYIPVPAGGALTVPYADGVYCEKDALKMCDYIGENWGDLKEIATKLYYIALENGGYVDYIPAKREDA